MRTQTRGVVGGAEVDPRPGATPGVANEHLELTYLRGGEPQRERLTHNGFDVTGLPELWSPYERERYEQRIIHCCTEGSLA